MKIKKPKKNIKCPFVEWYAWDYSFTYDLWIECFNKMEEYYLNKDNVVVIEKSRKQILKSINKLRKVLIKINYYDYLSNNKYYKTYKRKVKKYRKISNLSNFNIINWKKIPKNIQKELDKLYSKGLKESEREHKKDCLLFGELLHTDMRRIWD